jgi:hypothetical protein
MRATMSVEFMGAILRLGKKYDIGYLCEEGLKRLRLHFPATLERWQDDSGLYKLNIMLGANMEIGIIDLAHELSIPSCLPIAYFLFVTSYKLVSPPLRRLLPADKYYWYTRNISWEVLLMAEFWIAATFYCSVC